MKINSMPQSEYINKHHSLFPETKKALSMILSLKKTQQLTVGIQNLSSEELDNIADAFVETLLYFQKSSIEI